MLPLMGVMNYDHWPHEQLFTLLMRRGQALHPDEVNIICMVSKYRIRNIQIDCRGTYIYTGVTRSIRESIH